MSSLRDSTYCVTIVVLGGAGIVKIQPSMARELDKN